MKQIVLNWEKGGSKNGDIGNQQQSRMGVGSTALILNPFLEGMKEAGAPVELFYTKDLKIKARQGDYICWIKTPGKCMHRDDMEMLLPKLARADVWVFATPVYFDGISGALKNLIERMLPPYGHTERG